MSQTFPFLIFMFRPLHTHKLNGERNNKLPEKMIVIRLVKKFSPFMETKSSLSRPQKTATGAQLHIITHV